MEGNEHQWVKAGPVEPCSVDVCSWLRAAMGTWGEQGREVLGVRGVSQWRTVWPVAVMVRLPGIDLQTDLEAPAVFASGGLGRPRTFMGFPPPSSPERGISEEQVNSVCSLKAPKCQDLKSFVFLTLTCTVTNKNAVTARSEEDSRRHHTSGIGGASRPPTRGRQRFCVRASLEGCDSV